VLPSTAASSSDVRHAPRGMVVLDVARFRWIPVTPIGVVDDALTCRLQFGRLDGSERVAKPPSVACLHRTEGCWLMSSRPLDYKLFSPDRAEEAAVMLLASGVSPQTVAFELGRNFLLTPAQVSEIVRRASRRSTDRNGDHR